MEKNSKKRTDGHECAKAYPPPKRLRKPRSLLPREPKNFDDPEQLASYIADLRKFFHLG